MSDDDRDILAGTSVMVLAIANRQNLAEQAQQAQDLEDATEGMELPVRDDLRDDGHYCVRQAGHSGRHKHRPIPRMDSASSQAGATRHHRSSSIRPW